MKENILPIFSQAAAFCGNKDVGFHSHPGTELVLVTSGNCEIVIGKKIFSCHPGNLLIIPPEVEHNQHNLDMVENLFVVFLIEPMAFDSSLRLIELGDDPWIEPLIREICRMSKATCYELCDGLIYSLLKAITRLEQMPAELREIHPALVKAILMIEKRFSERISIDQIALAAGISKSYLRTLFIAQLGYSPQQYLQNFRMARAREALRNYYLTIEEVAAECGYEDTNYFIRLFRKEHQCTPGEFRKVLKERPLDAFVRC